MPTKFEKFSRLKLQFTRDMRKNDVTQFPLQYILEEGFEDPSYKVTVELVEKDSFIDSKGQKWVKQKE